MTAAQNKPFDPLALGSLEDCIPGSQGTITIEEAVLGGLALPQIALQDSRQKHTSSLSEKESYLFGLRGTLTETYRGALREQKTVGAIFAFSLCLPLAHCCLPEVSLCPCLVSLHF